MTSGTTGNFAAIGTVLLIDAARKMEFWNLAAEKFVLTDFHVRLIFPASLQIPKSFPLHQSLQLQPIRKLANVGPQPYECFRSQDRS